MGKIACATGHRPDKFDFGYNETDIRCINLKKCFVALVVLELAL